MHYTTISQTENFSGDVKCKIFIFQMKGEQNNILLFQLWQLT